MWLNKWYITITILLFSFGLKAQQQDGSVLERRVSINVQNQPISTILDQISWQARIYFSYDASIINTRQETSIQVVEKSLFFVLSEIFDPEKYSLTELENQIIISRKKDPETDPPENRKDTIPPKYFFLSGKILDQKKEDPIPFASISVFKEPIGTISNKDGAFLLKLHPGYIHDSLVVSCMGYKQIFLPAFELLDKDMLLMEPVSIRIREVKVTSISPEKLLENIHKNLEKNYSGNTKLMSAFYRETVKQDKNYINVSEAVLDILKSPYVNTFRTDLVRLVKARQIPDVQAFKWINFKLQGGPFTITKLDMVKTMESFIDPETRPFYSYKIKKVVWYNNHPVYILEFEPVKGLDFHGFVGELYVHRETFAIVHARFGFNRQGLRKASGILIKRKPRGVKAKASFVEYRVNYRNYNGKWHLSTARASVKFKIRSRRDKINSEFHSVSELLVTNLESTEMKRFSRKESFSPKDIFVEMIHEYDPDFWGNYNIIQPDEDLRNAIPKLTTQRN